MNMVYGISFHLFVSFSISFINVLQFAEYKSFNSLVKFIHSYFILFNAIINGIVFLISLSDSSLLVYRNTKDFCVMTLYSETLLNSFISFNSFQMKSLRFSIYNITLSANSDSFTSSLPIWMPFFFFSDCCGQKFQILC